MIRQASDTEIFLLEQKLTEATFDTIALTCYNANNLKRTNVRLGARGQGANLCYKC